jgi:DNA invertase Pin-like site-specific DNA recombinase
MKMSDVRRIKELRQQKLTIYQIAEIVGCGSTTVYNHLKDGNIKRLPLYPHVAEEVRKLYPDYGMKAIGQKLGLSYNHVRAYCDSMNLYRKGKHPAKTYESTRKQDELAVTLVKAHGYPLAAEMMGTTRKALYRRISRYKKKNWGKRVVCPKRGF